jgi:hypothetical protein
VAFVAMLTRKSTVAPGTDKGACDAGSGLVAVMVGLSVLQGGVAYQRVQRWALTLLSLVRHSAHPSIPEEYWRKLVNY